jgi:hypothetical protein
MPARLLSAAAWYRQYFTAAAVACVAAAAWAMASTEVRIARTTLARGTTAAVVAVATRARPGAIFAPMLVGAAGRSSTAPSSQSIAILGLPAAAMALIVHAHH